MNKITSTLAGLAIVATASIAPAMAQGNFVYSGGPTPFTFSSGTPGGINTSPILVAFNALTGPNSTGTLTLSGGTEQFGAVGTAGTFFLVTETFVPSTGPLLGFSDTGTVFVSQRSATTFDISSDTTTFTASGTSFDLVPGAVPEASTVVSFGALLALGGLAVVLRRKGVKSAV